MHTHEDENLDPVGPPDPRALFTKMAERFDVPGGMTDALWAYTQEIVDKCATISDAHFEAQVTCGAGDALRAMVYRI